ncbi:MAG: iron-containing alcohol dehydrogenase [Pseudomonadota bacterium]|nr:MAG: alcohol dehydrogenase [Pseudomonadota bacterium]
MAIHQFSFPTRIHFGPGAVGLLPTVLAEASCSRPLVVTDRGLASRPEAISTKERLAAGGLDAAVFAGVFGNPVKSQVIAGVEAFRQHRADSIVGLGGGAALDVAKAIALLVHHPGDLFDYEDGKPDARPIDREIPFWVSVPTTAGTGSEVGRSTVIADDATHVKKILFSPRLLAQRVLIDPELTLSLPAPVTAATGMDALTHLVEAYLARDFHPLCDGIALEGLRMVARSLPAAVAYARRIDAGERAIFDDPDHVDARGAMLVAAMMGGVAFQKGLGVTHSLAHALSTVCDLHHGLANGIVIPYAMRFNLDAVPERLGALAAAAGVPGGAPGFITWLESLRAEIGIPNTLAEVGVRPDHVDALVRVAVADGCHASNPRNVTEADFRALFHAALGAP